MSSSDHPRRPGRVAMFRMFLRERDDPESFYRTLARHTVAGFPFGLDGASVLDLGCGPGYYTEALGESGAQVTALDLSSDDLGTRLPAVRRATAGDARRLPFPEATFDGVFCSNMLEHTPAPDRAVGEMARVLRPGGWLWLSWTTWYSPWGGHAIAPLHYLGPRLGVRVWRRLFGEPRGANLPFDGVWPTHVGQILRIVRDTADLDLLDAVPRYYPSQRWIMRVPGLREVAVWNCLLLLRKVEDPVALEGSTPSAVTDRPEGTASS